MARSRDHWAYTLTHKPTGLYYIGGTTNVVKFINKTRKKLERGIHPLTEFQDVFKGWHEFNVSLTHCGSDFNMVREITNMLEHHTSLENPAIENPLCLNPTMPKVDTLNLSEADGLLGLYRRTPCVYRLTHVPTGRFYIGSTTNLRSRINRHRREVQTKDHHNERLEELTDNLNDFEIRIEVCDTEESARELEQKHLDEHHGAELCLNMGDSAIVAYKNTPDHIRKAISERRKGVATTPKGVPRTAEDKLKISIATRLAMEGQPGPNAGKHLSDVTKAKLSAARSKRLSIDGRIFLNVKEAAAYRGINTKTVKRRCDNTMDQIFKDWFYLPL